MTVTPPGYVAQMAEWRPWRALRERYPDVDVVLVDFPTGPLRALYVVDRGERFIFVDRALSPAERLFAVTHEIVHHERGVDGVGRREETTCDAIASERLLPVAVLSEFCRRRGEVEPITAALAADEFEVPEHVAERQLRRLIDRRSA